MNCESCRFWSQMVAQSIGCGPIEALCLAGRGTKFGGQMMRADATCEAWRSDHHGKVDDPPNYGELVQPLYDAEDGPDAST